MDTANWIMLVGHLHIQITKYELIVRTLFRFE